MIKRRTKKKRSPAKRVPSETQKIAGEGIEEFIYWHTAGIVLGIGRPGTVQVGTAAAVLWKGRHLLLTAGHVLNGATDGELRFIFRPQGTLERAAWYQSTSPQKISPFPASPIELIARYRSTEDDVAALEVGSSFVEHSRVRFFQLAEGSKLMRPIKSSLCTIGFPFDSFQRLNPVAGALTTFSLWGNLAKAGTNPPPDFDSRQHLLMDFLPAADGRHPGGFSGAGVWYQAPLPEPPRIWAPDLLLAGLITHYYPSRKQLLICRIERVVSFLSRTLPS